MRAFHYLHFWHPNMARWVERFPDRLAQSPELAFFAGDLMEIDVAPTGELIDCGASGSCTASLTSTIEKQ
jgi:hypothetical protein